MKVKAGDDTYKISWKHNIGNPYILSPGPVGEVYRGVTQCWVGRGGIELVGLGQAWCNKKDQYVKAVGRRLSLLRAIKDLPKNVRHEIRRAYWLEHEMGISTMEEYLKRKNDPAFIAKIQTKTYEQIKHALHILPR